MGLGRYTRDFVANWRAYDAPAGRKLRLAVRNRGISLRRLVTEGRSCCGHPGEPGC